MTLDEIRSKLRSGETIQNVCQEYQITFKQLCDYMFRLGNINGKKLPKRKGNGIGEFNRTGQLYISERDGKYYIRNKGKWFGTYRILEEAVKIRDWFIMNGRWDKRWVDRACRECNIRRCPK